MTALHPDHLQTLSMATQPAPPFTRCPHCGTVAMRLAPDQPVTCAGCGALK